MAIDNELVKEKRNLAIKLTNNKYTPSENSEFSDPDRANATQIIKLNLVSRSCRYKR